MNPESLKNGESIRAAAAKYGIDRKTLRIYVEKYKNKI